MKEFYRNPIFYYILIPAVAVLWPVILWAVYLPKAEEDWKDEKRDWIAGQVKITEILQLDPTRFDASKDEKAAVEFDYATAVNNIASTCDIREGEYQLNSRRPVRKGGQKIQNATVTLENVTIKKFAEFLYSIQLRWVNLQCVRVKLRTNKGVPDSWNIDIEFKYYY